VDITDDTHASPRKREKKAKVKFASIFIEICRRQLQLAALEVVVSSVNEKVPKTCRGHCRGWDGRGAVPRWQPVPAGVAVQRDMGVVLVGNTSARLEVKYQ